MLHPMERARRRRPASKLRIRIEGPNAREAMREIERLVQLRFDEE
jgi:phosphotransferase system HPr-like phosphotransfer protein